jgi:hypothetical protein
MQALTTTSTIELIPAIPCWVSLSVVTRSTILPILQSLGYAATGMDTNAALMPVWQ